MRLQTNSVTRILLCVLVLLLAVLAFRPFLGPEAAPAQVGSYDHVKYLGGFGNSTGAVIILLDARNGTLWSYSLTDRRVSNLGKLTELGKPLEPAR